MAYEALIITVFFAAAYAIKGGSGNLLENWEDVRRRSKILERIMDGKVLSTLMVFVFAVVFYEGDAYMATVLPIAWLVAVAPSMGEEHGAIGHYRGALDAYIERAVTHRGRLYDVKKGLQRGVWMGACMALATGDLMFICSSLLFVPAVFFGQSLNKLILRQDGWMLAEPFVGAVVFGLPFIL